MIRMWQLVIAILLSAGCSGRPGAIRPPNVDADDAAEAAIEQHDRNGDGQLAKDEWSASPVLASIAKRFDTSGDAVLDAGEISNGLAAWQLSGIGVRSVPFTVTLDGRPLGGAIVRLIPADFFDGAIKPATGQASPTGGGLLGMAPEDMPPNAPKMALVQPGLYRVEITHPSKRMPAKYNTETTLGIEISSGNPGPEGAVWRLTSK